MEVWALIIIAYLLATLTTTLIYLMGAKAVMPLVAISVILILLYVAYTRPDQTDQVEVTSQYDLFRDMEPADATPVNPWTGFIQEDVLLHKSGPIGTFRGTYLG